jgi:type II secretory pathway component PulF
MLTYRYTALSEQGSPSSGLIEASDEHQAADILRARKLLITSLEVKRETKLTEIFGGGKVSAKVLGTTTRQLTTMVTAGLPLTQSLEVLSGQMKQGTLKRTLENIIRDIDGGSSFSKSLEKYPNVFPRLYISLIKAGEASGNLDKILGKLSDSLEGQAELKSKVKGALIYPMIVLIAMAGVMVLMMVFVVPQMKTVYVSLNAPLPLSTKMLVGLSNLMTNQWYIFVIIVVAAVSGYRWFAKTLRGRYFLGDVLNKMPIFGKLTTEVQLTQFIETLALLIASGVPILDGLDIAKETLSNIRFQEATANIAQAVEKGTALAAAIERQPIFPIIVSQMAAIGEKTGKLDEVLLKIGTSFEEETDNTVKNLSTALEPIIMIVLGVCVGFLIFALLLPIYGILGSIT